jgi:hypothetical protein
MVPSASRIGVSAVMSISRAAISPAAACGAR